MSLRWSLLSSLPGPRSSHCAAVTRAGRLLLYAGEHQPRIPVDSALHVLDLESTPIWRTLSPFPTPSPTPRLGASSVYDPETNSIYVWGGRGGVDMAPLDRFQAGIWKASLDATDTPVRWERLPDDSGTAPASRSYHASVLAGRKVYIHAGCPASGRLADLHAYDLATHTWHALADAPTEPRGGTVIAVVSLPDAPEPVLIRFGGFAGVELPQVAEGAPPPLDIYTPSTDTWSTVYPAPDPQHGFPGPRAVHGLVPFTTSTHVDPAPIALLYHGEKDASSLGHAGAGTFWDDAWLLLAAHSTLQWKKLHATGTYHTSSESRALIVDMFPPNPGGAAPEPRGWFAPASYVSGGQTRIVLAGGLLSSNERSGQVWIGDVDL